MYVFIRVPPHLKSPLKLVNIDFVFSRAPRPPSFKEPLETMQQLAAGLTKYFKCVIMPNFKIISTSNLKTKIGHRFGNVIHTD